MATLSPTSTHEPTQGLCQTSSPELAPAWHTALLVGTMLAVATTGAILQLRNATIVAPSRPPLLPMLVVQWGLVFYVARVGRRRSALRDLVGEGWTTWRRAATDVGLAVAWAFGIVLMEHALAPAAVGGVRLSALEKLAWVPVALSVAFGEEVVFRGYLQTQLGAFGRSAAIGIACQAVLFGIAHADRGLAATLRIGLYGLGFGLLAWKRRSLIPGMIAHGMLDVTSGFV